MNTTRKDSGFVALFFVLSFATALGILVFNLSSKSTHMLTLFKGMRDLHIAKSSAIYCLQKLIDNKTINQGYRPVLGTMVSISDDSYCIYESFVETPQSGLQIMYRKEDIQNQSFSTYTANIVAKFTVQVRGTKKVLSGDSSPDVHHSLQREYYITDSL